MPDITSVVSEGVNFPQSLQSYSTCLYLMYISCAHIPITSADILSALQFCWSPKDPKLCALVTEKEQLLLGLLGEPLQPIDTYSSVTCVSWSPDGQLLAIASGQQVHIYNAHHHTACFDTKIEHQVGISTTATSQVQFDLVNLTLQPAFALHPFQQIFLLVVFQLGQNVHFVRAAETQLFSWLHACLLACHHNQALSCWLTHLLTNAFPPCRMTQTPQWTLSYGPRPILSWCALIQAQRQSKLPWPWSHGSCNGMRARQKQSLRAWLSSQQTAVMCSMQLTASKLHT